MKEFHYFTLEEIKEYAKKLGYDEVRIHEYSDGYCEVEFGQEYGESYWWSFENGLSQPSTEYDHFLDIE